MGKVEQIAASFGITDNEYTYEINSSGEIISMHIFEPDYDYSDNIGKSNIMKFISLFHHLEFLEIDLNDFIIETFDDISHLKDLKTLYVECDTQVKNLNFLAEMKNLEQLYIQSSDIDSLEGIDSYQKLTHFFLASSKIEDLAPLEKMTALIQLGICNSVIKDISPLRNLQKLKIINLNHNQLEDISALSDLTNLEHADISFNSVKNIKYLEKNILLKSLNISNNEISEIEVLKNFKVLNDLSAANNRIDDLSVLEDLKLLLNVDISGNKIKKITPLKNLTDIKILRAGNNPLEDLEKTEFASQFTYLNLENCGLKDISFLFKQHQLQHLILNNNSVKNFSSLEGKSSLKEIYLKSNDITETFPIHYFSDLKLIDLTENPFGNQMFTKYGGGHDLTGKKIGMIADLAKLNADYYYNKGMMDEALAYFYYENKDSHKYCEIFHIYLQKMLDTASSEVVYIKYYFSTLANFLRFYDNLNWLTEENYNTIHLKINSIKEPERTSMLGILHALKQKKRVLFNFNYYDFHFYEEKVSHPYISDELLFIKGSLSVERDNLMTNLYYLKLLKKRNSPFYFTLLHKIENVLKMNFAYTEEERKEHDYYRSLLQNLDKKNIPEKKAYFSSSYFDRHYHYVHYNHPESPDRKKKEGAGSGIILYVMSAIVLLAIGMAVRSCLNLF